MIHYGHVMEAYKEYQVAEQKADTFYKNGGRGDHYYHLTRESDSAWENYKELSDIYASGG